LFAAQGVVDMYNVSLCPKLQNFFDIIQVGQVAFLPNLLKESEPSHSVSSSNSSNVFIITVGWNQEERNGSGSPKEVSGKWD
jgi:FMN-dependent NADH-azoreductase